MSDPLEVDPIPTFWTWDQEAEATWERITHLTRERQLFTHLLVRWGAIAGRVIHSELREGVRIPLWKHSKGTGQFALNTVYMSNWDVAAGRYNAEGQLEVECNPTWIFSPRYTWVQRNRFEVRRVEYHPKWRTELRHRSRFIYHVEGKGVLKEVHLAFELFYRFDLHRLEQVRLTPIEWVFENACKQRVLFSLTWRYFLHERNERNRLMWAVEWVH